MDTETYEIRRNNWILFSLVFIDDPINNNNIFWYSIKNVNSQQYIVEKNN